MATEHGQDPVSRATRRAQHQWYHMVNNHISMPDKWEYPWYAWDLAFHTIALSTVDPEFAKQQLDLMLREFSSIRPARCGLSGTGDVNHRCMPGPPFSCTGQNRR